MQAAPPRVQASTRRAGSGSVRGLAQAARAQPPPQVGPGSHALPWALLAHRASQEGYCPSLLA